MSRMEKGILIGNRSEAGPLGFLKVEKKIEGNSSRKELSVSWDVERQSRQVKLILSRGFGMRVSRLGIVAWELATGG